MKKEQEKWSKGELKKYLSKDRIEFWRDDTIKMLSKWIGFKSGQTIIDVGCGLGYLGFIFSKYFGKDSTYLGVDHSDNLIKEAKELAPEWAKSGKTDFLQGDAYKLPYPDNSADIVMCQTLLMHLADPEKAIDEMIRVCKPKGKLVCIEPNNFAQNANPTYSPLEPDFEEYWLQKKITYYLLQGQKLSGKGDNAIGFKIPIMLKNAGLKDIDCRANDRVYLYGAPYFKKRTKDIEKNIKDTVKLHKKFEKNPDEKSKYLQEVEKYFNNQEKDFLLGGGKPKDYDQYRKNWYKNFDTQHDKFSNALAQLKDNTYYSNQGIAHLFITMGTKK